MPLGNSGFEYASGFFRQNGDVVWLFRKVPASIVHVYFILTIAAYVYGLYAVARKEKIERLIEKAF